MKNRYALFPSSARDRAAIALHILVKPFSSYLVACAVSPLPALGVADSSRLCTLRLNLEPVQAMRNEIWAL